MERDSGSLLLSMTGIGKAFSGQRVLDGVDFELRAGEVHVLAGENGAGKSTLIKILAGVHTEYDGAIDCQGQPMRFRSPQEANRRGISAIHQELSLIPSLSVTDNIFLGRERTAIGGFVRFAEQETECRKLLDRLGLAVDPRTRVGEYPISVQQLIEIAKALAFDSRILIMDEPTSALTEPEVKRLFSIMDGLKAEGCGIIYISHKMEEIYAVADRITVLRDGKKIGTSEAQLLSRSNLVKWMVGRDMDEQFPHRAAQWGEERLRVEDFTVPDPGGSGRPCVDGVSFSVRSGEIVGLGGLQGSGASELLNAIFGTYGRRIHGSIFVDGTPVASGSPRRSLRHGIALLTNDRKTSGLVLGMTVRENVTLASVEKVSPGTWMQPRRERRIGRDTVESLGVRCRTIEQPVETLSGGNQQKIVLGKWLNTDPRVLLLDEPTRGVDVGAKHEIYELMHKCTESGIAIVLITSEMPELLALSDRILVMHRGRIATELHRDDASPEAVLRAAMGQSDDSGYPKSSTVKRDSTTADPTGEPR